MINEFIISFKMDGFLWGILLLASLYICSECATLPKVTKVIEETPQKDTFQIALAKRLLSPEQSDAIMPRLSGEAGPTDVMKSQINVIESVSGVTLKSVNRGTLLLDGSLTYAAIFKAIYDAWDYIILETFILAYDEDGQRICDLLLQKQVPGALVSIMYDSVGSIHNPAAQWGEEGISLFEKLEAGDGRHYYSYASSQCHRLL